jgi:ribosomal protein L29
VTVHFIDYKTNEQILNEETETLEEKLRAHRRKLPTIRANRKIGGSENKSSNIIQ